MRMTKFITLLGAAVMAASASATFRSINIVNPPQSNAGGQINSVSARQNLDGSEFTWSANFSANPSGKKTNGFWLVVSPGPNPKGHAGELAIFYLDASNPTPTLTAYAYNGVNGDNSWITPADKILSSKNAADASSIYSLTSVNEANGSRTLGFSINPTKVNNHIPTNPGSTPWTGSWWNQKIGIWFHPVVDLKTSYNQDGYLTKWQFGSEGWYDAENVPTVPEPATFAVMGLGVAAMIRRRGRK